MEDKYKNEYDDPYKMLACSIAVRFNYESCRRMMSDKDYIRQIIQAEVRDNIDIPGPFSDCITTELISEKQRVLYRDALNQLGLFFYKTLDTDRFRRELKAFYEQCGLDLSVNKK